MSKYVKDLLIGELQDRLEGVSDALVVSVNGLDANRNNQLRMALRSKNIKMRVIKNSLARRATEGTPLAPALEGLTGPAALVWGADDIVALAKEVVRFAEDKNFEPFHARGGVMEGARLSSEQVKEVSTWPSREEMLGLLVGQMMAPATNLIRQFTGAGSALASQIQQHADAEDGDPSPATEES